MKHILLSLGAIAGLFGAGASCAAGFQAAGPAVPRPAVEFFDSGRFGDAPVSDAVRVGHLSYFSGEIGDTAGQGPLVPGGIKAETWRVMDNLKASVEANGYRMQDIVKCTALLADMAELPAFNEIYRSYFSRPYPVRSAFGVNGLALGARVEVECVASR